MSVEKIIKELEKKIDEIIDARLTDIFELVENHLKKIKIHWAF